MKLNFSNYFRSRKILISLALRNLRQHRSKSLIIASIMSISVYVLIVGLTTINTIESGINKAFIDYFTGDVFIRANADYKYSLLGIQSPGGLEDNPVLPEYTKIFNYIEAHPSVKSATPYITGAARLSFENQGKEGQRGGSFLIGIDGATYYDSFESKIVEGTGILPDQRGVVLSKSNRAEIQDYLDVEINIGDPVTLYGFGNGGFAIRTVPLVGVFEFVQGKKEKNYLGFIDGDTFKDLKGLYYVNEPLNISEDKIDLLDVDLSDDAFIDDFFSDDVADAQNTLDSELNLEIERELEDSSIVFDQIWEFLVIHLDDPRFARGFIRDVNKWLDEQGIDASAGDWKAAAYPMSTMADAIRIIFMIVVGIVFCIAVMIVINTLVVSVLERTPEIGTMRALGAQKSFVKRLFNYEIFFLSLFSGLTGLILAFLTIFIIRLCKIESTNGLTFVLYSGNYLNPIASFSSIFGPFITIMIAGFVANIYPLHLASGVAPVVAMREK
ncbi:MAG: ABC transporter permease [Spirochaetales bacterium]|nr:ABC transporter permease [Spirochaetales bacterium]